MNDRVEYEMSEADLKELLDAMQPVPMIMLQCGKGPSRQEMANSAWDRLGRRMGFKPMTVRPNGKGNRFFSAEPIEVIE